MTALHAFILGLVQGLTEFLPVSSSGHLLVLQKAFGINSEGDGLLLFNILLHVGTLAAVVIIYRQRIWNMICHPFKSELKWLVVATIPAVIAALAVDFDDAFEGRFIIWSFYLTSLVLVASGFIGDQRRRQRKYHKDVRWYDAVAMGVMQAVAILPGLSRSGSTIAGGLTSGLTRRRAADFAFLMSIPAILGSVVLEGKDLLLGNASMSVASPGVIVLGVLTAAVSGFAAIKLMLMAVRRISLNWFALYTFLLGTFLLLDRYVFGMFMA